MSSPSFPKIVVVCDFCKKSFDLPDQSYQSYYAGQISFYCSKECKKSNTVANALARIESGYVSLGREARQGLKFENMLRRVKELEEFRLENAVRIQRELNAIRRVNCPSDESRTDEMIVLHLAGETLSQIGDKFGVTRERVRQLLARRGYSSKTAPERPKKPRKVYELKCCGCEKVFESNRKMKYCSDDCRYPNTISSRHKFQKFTCSGCGCEFERSEYLININKNNKNRSGTNNTYCNRECYLKYNPFGRQRKSVVE